MISICCKDLEHMLYAECLMQITEYELQFPKKIQKHSLHMGELGRPLKLDEIYLYDEEYKQIQGEPFKFCPWCGAKVEK